MKKDKTIIEALKEIQDRIESVADDIESDVADADELREVAQDLAPIMMRIKQIKATESHPENPA